MKRILLTFCMLALALGVFARKSYVTVRYYYSNTYYTVLSGDIPSGMKDSYNSWSDNYQIGDILNMLSNRGYEVEFMSTYENSATQYNMMFLLSSPGAPIDDPSSSAPKTKADRRDDARVVARYNIQGQPVAPSTKGVQIMVYSDYTTDTILVE